MINILRTALSAIAILTATSASAVTVLDQDYSGASQSGSAGASVAPWFGRAQTFTVGVAGTLSRIEFLLSVPDRSVETIDILSTVAGAPVGGTPANPTVVGTAGGVNVGGWASFDVLSMGISVAVGDVLAFKIWNGYRISTDPIYFGAQTYFYNNGVGGGYDWKTVDDNAIFRTYVEDGTVPVPLPATLPLLVTGFGMLALWRRRQTRV
ncbi:hypothetical protein D6850_01035 [Roseovarius spongiae]|uniref:VPLPA-CTERM sorting domain-containing protein n=1 Tax=Roseovarius spongiae TaxID=2320272 RepID=A0A3A8AVB0_9RHOB|nr:VPLPA-CTERM sorting domain-containing protein [Roseovarius spongiae]RKF16183.1 hypothetical protein D6850_01035 [Roseovarius spongiae]